MEFLNVIPNKVINPTTDPIDNIPPPIEAAIKPPIKAKGKFIKTSKVFLIFPIANRTRNNTAIVIKNEIIISSFRASFPSTALPVILV